MNPEFEAHGSDFPGLPEGPSVLVAGRLQSEPRVAFLPEVSGFCFAFGRSPPIGCF